MAINTLFEVTVLQGNTPITLRMASASASAAGTQLNGYQWLPLVTKRHSTTGTWASDGILSEGSVNHGGLSFRMSSAYENESWSAYEWTGGLARIFIGEEGDSFASYKQVFEGSVSSLDRDGVNATVGLLGPDALLDRNLLSIEYLGTGGAEGPPGKKGQLKPRLFGYTQNVDPVLIDAARWIYQVHGYGAITGIRVYDFAQELDASKNKGDAGNYATLAGLKLAPGEWATCSAEGLFRLGGATDKKVTADVTPVGPTTLSGIVRQLLGIAGISSAKIGTSVDAFTAPWSLYLTDQATVGEVARNAVYQTGGVLFADGTGKWQAMDYFAASTAIVLNADRSTAPLVKSVKEIPAAAPVWKVKIGYDRCWSVHSSSEISPSLSATSDEAQAAFDAAQAAKDAADQAVADAAANAIRIDSIVSDNVLDRSEKAYIEQRFGAATAERPALLAKGAATAERTSYSNAYDVLKTYLESLVPAYTDGTQDTPIDRVVFDQNWTDFDNAKSVYVASLATWDGTTGPNKPQDNATVGAPIGTNVGSIPVADVVTKINALTAGGFTDNAVPPVPTGLTTASILSDAGVTFNTSWNPVSDSAVASYIIAIKEGSGNYVEFPTTASSYSRTALCRNTLYTAKVSSVSKAGVRSGFSAEVALTTARDTVAPAAPLNLAVEPSFTTGFVSFTAPADSDVSRVQINLLKDGVEVRHVSVNVRPGMNGTATFSNLNRSTEYGVQALAIDTSDNVSPATNTVLFTTSGGISIADFTPGLSGITTVATLPSPISYTGATTVFNQTDGKLWNYSGGAWVAAVDATVADDSITATKITNGAISTPKLAALAVTVDKLAAGSVTTDKLVAGAVQAAQIAAGAITVDKLLVTSMSELNPDPGFKDITYWLNRGVLNAPMGLGPGSVAGWYSTHDAGMNAIMGTRNYAMLWGGYFNSTGRQHLYSPRCYNMKGGATYQLGFAARNASNQDFTVITRMYDVNGTLLADAAVAVSITPVKTAFNVQFLAPANVISYEFIVFNASGTAYTGDMEITDLQLLEAVGGTAIRNGAITTDKIVANAITADKILGGTITGDKFNTGTSLPGTITVGNTGVAIGTTAAQAANGGTMKWYDASSGNQYNFYGTRIQRDAPTIGWHGNAYTTEGFRNAAKISAQMDTPDTFIGLATGRPYNNANDYQQINYSIHRSSNGTIYAYEYGAAYVLTSDAGGGIVYSVIYDGKTVTYVRDNDNATMRTVAAPAGMTVFGAVSLYSQGSAVSRVAMTGGMDNSLNGSDPAARINAYSTTIDPGRVLIQGGTTLDAWRDQTEIRGGAIKTNSVSAEKIAINARGISVIGCDFEYNPVNGYLYWRDGHVLYTDDAGNPASPYIPAGSVAWGGGSYNYIMWDKGAGGFRQVVDNWEQAQVRNSNSIIMCTWRNGPSFVANYGGTIVHGDRITTRTINADRMNVNSLSAISANVGTVTAGLVRSSNGNAYFDLDNARIVFNNGSVMKVQGVGFGSANQFIEWFGPVQSSFTSCTEANATYYLKTNGSAYFGGSLSAGVLKNSVQTTSQAYDASVTTGTFGSNGKSRVVTVGYQASSSTNITGQCPTPYTPYATIRLYRGTTAGGTLLAEQTFNGSHSCSPGTGQFEPGSMVDGIGGSLTYTDNTGGSSSSYFVQIVGRNIMTTNLAQSLGVTSIEQ